MAGFLVCTLIVIIVISYIRYLIYSLIRLHYVCLVMSLGLYSFSRHLMRINGSVADAFWYHPRWPRCCGRYLIASWSSSTSKTSVFRFQWAFIVHAFHCQPNIFIFFHSQQIESKFMLMYCRVVAAAERVQCTRSQPKQVMRRPRHGPGVKRLWHITEVIYLVVIVIINNA